MKTAELRGADLDWAVAKAEGHVDDVYSWLYEATLEEVEDGSFHPSTDWAQGGPIIEREKMDVAWFTWIECRASVDWLDEDGFESFGPTPLIAAMRAYVASKLGDDVDIPGELK